MNNRPNVEAGMVVRLKCGLMCLALYDGFDIILWRGQGCDENRDYGDWEIVEIYKPNKSSVTKPSDKYIFTGNMEHYSLIWKK